MRWAFDFTISAVRALAGFALMAHILRSKRIKPFAVIAAIIVTAAAIFASDRLLTVSDFPYLRWLAGTVCFFVGACVAFKERAYICSAFSLLIMYLVTITEIIIGTGVSLLRDEQFLRIHSGGVDHAIVSSAVLLAQFVLFLLIYRMFSKTKLSLQRREWLRLNAVMGVFLAVAAMFLSVHSYSKPERATDAVVLVLSFAFLFMSMIVLSFFITLCRSFQAQQRVLVLESEFSALEQQMALEQQNAHRLCRIRHDVKNQLLSVAALISGDDNDAASRLLVELIGQTDGITLSPSQSTGNAIIDAVASCKAALCAQKGVQLEYAAEMLPEINVCAADISSVLSNLLDNAIEGAQKTDNPAVSLRVFSYKDYLTFVMSNSVGDSIDPDKQALLTTKADRENHGYGMGIITEICERHGGSFHWSIEDGCFIAAAMMGING